MRLWWQAAALLPEMKSALHASKEGRLGPRVVYELPDGMVRHHHIDIGKANLARAGLEVCRRSCSIAHLQVAERLRLCSSPKESWLKRKLTVFKVIRA